MKAAQIFEPITFSKLELGLPISFSIQTLDMETGRRVQQTLTPLTFCIFLLILGFLEAYACIYT